MSDRSQSILPVIPAKGVDSALALPTCMRAGIHYAATFLLNISITEYWTLRLRGV